VAETKEVTVTENSAPPSGHDSLKASSVVIAIPPLGSDKMGSCLRICRGCDPPSLNCLLGYSKWNGHGFREARARFLPALSHPARQPAVRPTRRFTRLSAPPKVPV